MSSVVGELKKIVSLVDRTDFDEYVYPRNETSTVLQPTMQKYHNFIQESIIWNFTGSPQWGQRITFSIPWPWQGDLLNWIALRLKPRSWMTHDIQAHIGPDRRDWVPLDPDNFWIWANSLGTAAIERAEMEVNGVIIESFSGDWLNVWNKTYHGCTEGVAYDDGMYGSYGSPTIDRFKPSEDGYIYCYLPFAFAKHSNTAFPLISCARQDSIRFHITLRPFHTLVRKLKNALECDESLLGKSFEVRDYTFPFRKFQTCTNLANNPQFEAADFICGVSTIDGPLREAYMHNPHEILLSPVSETAFYEPLKYVVNTGAPDTIKIQLPLREANGPIRQLYFFLRRKAAIEKFRDYNNYGALLENEVDNVWNPERPLLRHAQLQVGTAIWADEGEKWWRATGNLVLPGGIRGYGNFIYCYNFAEKPTLFDPSGSLNASRIDMRLNLTVAPPGGASDGEWTVHVFYVGTNWIRFENGLANMVFMD